MNSELQVITTREFNGVHFNCYKAENEDDGFWATREQIGMLLGYKDPVNSIMKIHTRNADRLDKFSTWVKLSQVEGNRTVTRDVIVYSFMGFLEICRFSNQPKADAVIDFAWSVMNEIRKTGSYNTQDITALHIRAAELLKDIAQYASKEEKEIILHEAFKLATGYEMPKKQEKPKAPAKYYTAEQIGKILNWPADAVINRARSLRITERAMYGYWDGDIWYFSKAGREKFLEMVEKKIVRMEGDMAIYENGFRRIYWDFDRDYNEYQEHNEMRLWE